FSLAAVFLALGLGIAIGSALPGTDTLLREQEKVITRLEKEFAQLRDERRALEEMVAGKEGELAVLHRFHREIFPLLAGDVLNGCKVVFLKNGEISEEAVEELGDFLREAGAVVTATLSFDDRSGGEELAALLGLEPGPTWAGELWAELAAELGGEKTPTFLPLLQELAMVRRHISPPGPVDAVVVLGGRSPGAGLVGLELAAAARATGLTVVGTEPLTIGKSWVPKYKSLGLISVDNIDTFPGRVALVFALAGAGEGHYGMKETAASLLPAFPGKGAGRHE
ncbi:MAG: copper transporter, partial [Firmicutes bacterium]|nr:copper transporter [Bacillota bacterium]